MLRFSHLVIPLLDSAPRDGIEKCKLDQTSHLARLTTVDVVRPKLCPRIALGTVHQSVANLDAVDLARVLNSS